jgi:hypothetical protein
MEGYLAKRCVEAGLCVGVGGAEVSLIRGRSRHCGSRRRIRGNKSGQLLDRPCRSVRERRRAMYSDKLSKLGGSETLRPTCVLPQKNVPEERTPRHRFCLDPAMRVAMPSLAER